MGQLEKLRMMFASVRQDIMANFAATGHSDRIAWNVRGELATLSEMVHAMERQIRGLTARVDALPGLG